MKNIIKIAIIIFSITNIAIAEINVTNVKARPSIGTLKSSAIYMEIENKNYQSDVLIGAKTLASEICEIHKTVISNDIHQMVKIDKLALPANTKISLAPHHLHIMLINLNQPLIIGEKFPVTLSFQNAGDITVEALVTNINENR